MPAARAWHQQRMRSFWKTGVGQLDAKASPHHSYRSNAITVQCYQLLPSNNFSERFLYDIVGKAWMLPNTNIIRLSHWLHKRTRSQWDLFGIYWRWVERCHHPDRSKKKVLLHRRTGKKCVFRMGDSREGLSHDFSTKMRQYCDAKVTMSVLYDLLASVSSEYFRFASQASREMVWVTCYYEKPNAYQANTKQSLR